MQKGKKKLGELLVEEGRITAEQLDRALQMQTFYGGRIGTALVELEYLSLDDLGYYLALQRDCPDAGNRAFDKVGSDLVHRIPKEVCTRYHVFPLQLDNNKVLYL